MRRDAVARCLVRSKFCRNSNGDIRASSASIPPACTVGGVIFDYDFVRRTVADVSEILREVSWGGSTWEDACRRLTAALPGSVASILNYDLPRRTVNADFVHGIDPAFVESYRDHYARVNPWMDFWAAAPSGAVRVSERDLPARTLRDSEFYNDWLAPQESMEAAVGLRLDVDASEIVHLTWHYDVGRATLFDGPAAAILDALKPGIADSVRTGAMLRQALDTAAHAGSLIEHIAGAALVVDRHRRIRHANAEAEVRLGEGEALSSAADILSLRDPAAQKWLEETVARLAAGEPVAVPTTAVRTEGRIFRISASRVPFDLAVGPAKLVPPQPLVLVVARLLVGGRIRLDHVGLRFAYGLSAAEMRLCEILVEGHSLARAARMLGVSDGTVRQRIKLIFQKTRTHRQGELVALLARFAGTGETS